MLCSLLVSYTLLLQPISTLSEDTELFLRSLDLIIIFALCTTSLKIYLLVMLPKGGVLALLIFF